MSEQDFKNPFAALFPCADEGDAFRTGVISSDIIDRLSKSSECSAQESSSIEMQTSDPVVSGNEESDKHQLTHFYEDVFRLTLSKEPCCNKNGPASLIFLNEVHVALRYQTDLDETCIDRAVFERLLLGDPSQHTVHRKTLDDDDQTACEKRAIFYLYQSYHRLKQHTDYKIGPVATAHHVIVNQTASALCNPEMFPEAKLSEDFMKLFLHYHDQTGHCEVLSQFLCDVASSITDVEGADLASVMKGSFSFLQEKFMKTSVSDRNLFLYIDVLNYFMASENLVKAFLKHSMPSELKSGKAYQNSLLGLPLSVSCLPRSEVEPFEFFQEPSRYPSHYHDNAQERLSLPLSTIARNMHRLFDIILRKSLDTREMLLQWLGNCLDANSGREKIGSSEHPEIYSSLHASDGFFINLTAVLLLLCKPFAEPCSPKLFKVDPRYCATPVSTESNRSGVHVKSIANETCLLPRDEPMATDQDNKFNFLTECFFATHYALRLGFHVIHEKMGKLNQELVRFQRVYENARTQGIESSEIAQRIKENMEKGVSKFLTYRTALIVPETLDLLLKFHIASATWLVSNSTDNALNVFKTLKYPPINETSNNLSYIPEFVMENIIDCSIVVKRFSSKSFEMAGPDLDHFMTLIVMFMGSRKRVMNPHLRARLAEMMECLLPASEDEPNTLISSVFREKLFMSHLFVDELIPTLLNVFVSIEMTGQSVQFDQKFQYRRPMTIVLDYLWKFDIHKKKMRELAEDAEKNIEASQPPLFLHFINLLINDAIYLLDEALSCMSQLREIQQARDGGSWTSLSWEQQQQQEGEFQHMGNLAKFHNVMSNVTIHTLQWLTTEIKSIFCHPSIVERITAMLNYFLLHLYTFVSSDRFWEDTSLCFALSEYGENDCHFLRILFLTHLLADTPTSIVKEKVGPQKKNFKVKDLKEYEFKPQELVRDICLIYQNLGAGDDAFNERFCSAVSRDGRSYNRDLFPLAQIVLSKIGSGVLASQLDVIANKVHQLAVKQQHDDEMSLEAPEEFFDPIMNTVMKDPVKLPSSGVTVDRATIVRHLLSDQTDPFNRSVLTMDMVIPDEEMKVKIENWFQERNSRE